MKRLSLLLFGVLAAIVLATLDLSMSGGGVQHSTAYAANIAQDTSTVCVALPILNPLTKPLQTTTDCPSGVIPNDQPGGAIVFYLKQFLFLINSLVGGIIILVLVVAGIQYITSAGEPANVKSAKGRVTNAVIALVLYMMMVAILNFLVPGGLLS